jgi:ribonucleoside-diphosphate reductase alpha chain
MTTDSPHGPRTEIGQFIHATKYRTPDETFDDYAVRYARTTADGPEHFRRLLRHLRAQTILPGGRQQLSVGRGKMTTALQCFVGETISDDTAAIFDAVKNGALTMRAGGGVGWDFSTIRPKGEPIRGLGYGAYASGPISFMEVWDAMCRTIMSAGERRGAMMGDLRIDHPDVVEFVNAKRNLGKLNNFNISVTVTDAFMEALSKDGLYDLTFDGRKFGEARAADVWGTIMESNWDFAEPGVIFVDRINQRNPLWYCETIAATNPCAEQPLPPSGCCLLGSLNVAKLVVPHDGAHRIDLEELDDAVDAAVRAFDNVIDRTVYPLPQQEVEEKNKRRMGVGVTGMANALELCGCPYGSPKYLATQDVILERLKVRAYRTSAELAEEKGSFPLYVAEKYAEGPFFKELPADLRDEIARKGLRNGLLTSIAPTGTISLAADNVSSGIEPVFSVRARRTVLTPTGPREFDLVDYGARFYGHEGKPASEVTAEEHVDVLCRAQRHVDSAVSKTCNVTGQIGGEGPGVPYSDFVKLYLRAWEGGAKSCATFNVNGKRSGIIRAETAPSEEGAACFFDPATGSKECA